MKARCGATSARSPGRNRPLRNLPGFVRFLPVAARLHGQKLNVSRISRDAAVARSTVASYLRVLEDTLVAWRLSPPTRRTRGSASAGGPKLYWVDPGLVRAARRRLGPVGSEERGPLFEGWVLGLLRACREEGPLYDDLRHWAAAGSRVEVDALLLRGRERLAIEVKASGRLHSSQLRGLQAVADLPRHRPPHPGVPGRAPPRDSRRHRGVAGPRLRRRARNRHPLALSGDRDRETGTGRLFLTPPEAVAGAAVDRQSGSPSCAVESVV